MLPRLPFLRSWICIDQVAYVLKIFLGYFPTAVASVLVFKRRALSPPGKHIWSRCVLLVIFPASSFTHGIF